MNYKSVLPILNWLPSYKKEWIKGDLNAGLTVGIILVPQGIAYAMIAGLPPIYGLYTALIPQIIYAIFGTSRQLSVGPVAMDSLIVASGVAALAEIGSDRFIEFAILLSLMMGVLQIIFGIVKLGFLVNFLSKPVISGFTSAAALIIGLNQLKHLVGIDIDRNNRLQFLIQDAIGGISELNWTTTFIGFCSIILLIWFRKKANKIPSAMIVVVISILAVKFFNLEAMGVDIVGEIPKGLPSFRVPDFDRQVLTDLFPIALTLSFIAFLEAISVARAIEAKHDYKVAPNQELFSLGFANVVGSFFQAYPSTGGFSRTAVNDQSNANTPLASIFSAIVVGLTLLFLTPVFYYLPKAVLAAIIMVAVFGLLDFKVPMQLYKYCRKDLIILNITLLITAVVGIKEGIITGILLSLGMLIYRSTKPHMAVLGKVPETHFYRNLLRFKEVEIQKEILIVRFDAQLYFANTSFFVEQIKELANKKGDELELVIIDGESINELDSSAIYALEDLYTHFKNLNIQLAFTGLKGPVRDKLNASGYTDKIGCDFFFMSIQAAVDYYKSGFKKDEDLYKYVHQSNK